MARAIADSGVDVEAAVRLEQQVHVFPDGFAHGGHASDREAQGVLVDRHVSRPEGVELEGGEALLDHGGSGVGELVRRVGVGVPSVGVESNALPAGASEQLVGGDTEGFADNVPQRHIDTADGGLGDGAAPVVGLAVHGLPEPLDIEGVLSDDVPAEPLQRLSDAAVQPGDARLTNPDDARVSDELDQDPIL